MSGLPISASARRPCARARRKRRLRAAISTAAVEGARQRSRSARRHPGDRRREEASRRRAAAPRRRATDGGAAHERAIGRDRAHRQRRGRPRARRGAQDAGRFPARGPRRSPAAMSAASTASAAPARVRVDGEIVRGCLMLAVQCDGAHGRDHRGRVRLRRDRRSAGRLREAQRAAMRLLHAGHAADRAGTARKAGGVPSREEIREHLSGNYCRCTGYHAIVDAVEAVARARAGAKAVIDGLRRTARPRESGDPCPHCLRSKILHGPHTSSNGYCRGVATMKITGDLPPASPPSTGRIPISAARCRGPISRACSQGRGAICQRRRAAAHGACRLRALAPCACAHRHDRLDAAADKRAGRHRRRSPAPSLPKVITPWVGVLSHLKGLKSAPQHAIAIDRACWQGEAVCAVVAQTARAGRGRLRAGRGRLRGTAAR